MNDPELLQATETKEDCSITFEPTPSPSTIRPIIGTSNARILDRNMLNHLLKSRLTSLSAWGLVNGLHLKAKRYRKQGSVGRISKFLSELELNPLELNKLRFRHLFRLTKNLRKLQNLNFGLWFPQIQRYRFRSREQFKKIDDFFRALKNLTVVNLIRCEFLIEKNLKRLGTWIQSLQRLQSLEIDLRVFFAQGLKFLSQGIGRLKSLTRLHFAIDNEKIEDATIEHLLKGIGRLEGLSELYLIFKSSPKITSDYLLKSVTTCLKKLDSLTKLTLIIANCQGVADEGLQELSQGLKSLKLLSVLKLDFNPCYEVKDLGVTRLGEGLKELKYLTSLDLILGECPNIGNQGLCHLFSRLKNCRALKRIAVSVKNNFWIGDASLRALGFLLQELEEITEVTLDFSSSNSKITEKGLQSLFETLEYLKNIKALKLNFSMHIGSSGKNLLALASSMKTWNVSE